MRIYLVMERFSSQVQVPIKIYYHIALKVKIRFIFRRGVNIVNYAEKNFKLYNNATRRV